MECTSPDAAKELALSIVGLATDLKRAYPLTVVCVGTDRSTGDSLGPLVGTMLSWGSFHGTVLGDLDSPVHAENLEEVISGRLGDDGIVLGVDACLGSKQEVGRIMVRPGPLRPGLGVKKKLSPLGDLYVAGVVNVGGFMEYMVLQNTRLSLVMKMAETIAGGIIKAESMLASAVLGNVTHTTPKPVSLQSPFLQALSRRR